MATHPLPKRFYLSPLSRGQPMADGVGVMVAWRDIERALIETAKSHGHSCDQLDASGDMYIDIEIGRLNATELAKELAERLK